jgi:hypothetical protein
MRLLLSIFTVLMVTSSGIAQRQGVSNSGVKLPKGNWTVSCGPSETPGSVVDLYMVGSDASTGVQVTDVWLRNRSNQDVAAVKIAWKVYEKANPQLTLLSGKSPQFLGVPLARGERRVVNFPVVTFAKIYPPLLRRGKITGNYRIELTVADVAFDNTSNTSGVTYRRVKASGKIGPATSFLKVASKPAEQDDDDLGCQNQECAWAASQSCYTCFTQKGSTCAWYNCSYCKSGRCKGLIE